VPQVGRPRTTTDAGVRAPTTQRSVPSVGLGAGTSISPLTGRDMGWTRFIDEHEFVPELVWPQSVPVFDQMRSDSQLSALYTAVAYGISQLRFIIDPNSAKDEIVTGVAEDLNLPIRGQDDYPRRRLKHRFAHSKFIGQALKALMYGHAYFEQVGSIVDGKWRLRKMPLIEWHTIENINIADDGGLVSLQQYRPFRGDPTKPPPEIAVDGLVGFIFDQEGANWVGRSMFRDCYKDWLIKDRLVRIDAINHERAGGVPLAAAPAGATPGEVAALGAMMQDFRVGENSGGAVPSGTDITIARGTNSKVVESISQRDESMARRFMLMLVNLAQGSQHVGSYALGETFEDFFIVGQRAIVQWYCDTMTEHLVEDWVDWNYGEDEELVPQLTWERTSEDSLGTEQLSMLVDKGVIQVDDELEAAIRYKYRLPKRTSPRIETIVDPNEAPPVPEVDPSQTGGAGKGKGAPSASKPAPASTKVAASLNVYDQEREEAPTIMASIAETEYTEAVLVTVPNVAILEAGVEYDLGTGPATFTPEDLADAVTAANEDPSIRDPRLKLGHIDPRYNGPQFDATPSFGSARNLRLSDNGMVVYADYVGVPKWLAPILATAFPSRSIEGSRNVQSHAGKSWKLVLRACSLLGVRWPGIVQLDDLPMLAEYYGEEIPATVEIDQDLVALAAIGRGEDLTVTASANLDDVRRAFYQEYVPQSGNSWWWVRAVMVDPNQLVVEDDESGQLYLMGFSSDEEGNVSFDEPQAVRVEYVTDNRETLKEAASYVAAALAVGREVTAKYESRADSRPDAERGGMDPKEIRRRLNLPEDATDEQVQQAKQELDAMMKGDVPDPAQPPAEPQPGTQTPEGEPAPGAPQPPAQPEPDAQPGTTQPETQPETQQQPASVAASETVVVDKATWEEVRAGASAGTELKTAQAKKRNEDEVMAAINDGRIPPARKEHWLNALQVDYEGNSKVLASLAPGLVPVEQRSNGQTGETLAASEQQQVQQWTRGLFPETQALEASGEPQSPLIIRT
jgi:hypothetical protein